MELFGDIQVCGISSATGMSAINFSSSLLEKDVANLTYCGVCRSQDINSINMKFVALSLGIRGRFPRATQCHSCAD